MSERDLIGDLRLTRERFATLVAEIRPELHRYCARMTGSIADGEDVVQDTLARAEALHTAVSRFVALAPAQRSCVILKDVLGHSLDEIATTLGMTVPAVKAALHRGRSRLRELRTIEVPTARSASPEIARYAALFNARDWDTVRAMLTEDARLDLVAHALPLQLHVHPGRGFAARGRLPSCTSIIDGMDGAFRHLLDRV